jgi:hypothetical protein
VSILPEIPVNSVHYVDTAVAAVIARSDSDEAIQTISVEEVWIASAYALPSTPSGLRRTSRASADRSLALAMTVERATHRPMRKLPVVHISSCAVGQITTIIRASRRHKRGASRSSRTLEAGCDGRGVLFDEPHDADGEVVWSWRPDAGASLCEMTQSDGDNKARSHRGEHEASR